MLTVKQLLDRKQTELFHVAPDAAVIEALRLMAVHGIGAVAVLQGKRLVGMLSERDYARKVVLLERSSSDTQVVDIMSTGVITVALSDDIGYCMKMMTDHRVRHLPVCMADAAIGMISIGDVVKAVMEQQQVELEQLHRYIAS